MRGDASSYRSAQASYQLDMATRTYAKRGGVRLRERSAMTPEQSALSEPGALPYRGSVLRVS